MTEYDLIQYAIGFVILFAISGWLRPKLGVDKMTYMLIVVSWPITLGLLFFFFVLFVLPIYVIDNLSRWLK